jgi:two-component system invasion response regulator UvrY
MNSATTARLDAPGATTRVLVLAGDRIAQAGYRVLEETDPRIRIDTAVDPGAAALNALQRGLPDVLLVDLTDERLNGTELIPDLVAAYPNLPVLAVSAHEDLIQAEIVLQGGASGYVCRSAPLEEIIKAIHMIAAGSNYLDPALAQRIALQKLMGKTGSLRLLSPREYEVFCMMVEGVPINDIARFLNLERKTVANYSGTIKAKLKVHSREELLTLARRAGVASSQPSSSFK